VSSSLRTVTTGRIAAHAALAFAAGSGLVILGVAKEVTWPLVAGPLAALVWLALVLRRPLRVRAARRRPFPEPWRKVLQDRVRFYRQLDDDGRARFEENVAVIVADHDFEGVGGADVDDEVRVLSAAGAAILVHGMREVRLPNQRAILIYPDHFDDEYGVDAKNHILGMVHHQGPIIFSLKALRKGWSGARDGMNVAIHEFAHVLDLADGFADGVPAGARPEAWEELVKDELERVRKGRSALRPYAGTNRAELFAVATEVFFERPEDLRRRHAELFDHLVTFYGVDPARPRDARAMTEA